MGAGRSVFVLVAVTGSVSEVLMRGDVHNKTYIEAP